MMHEVDSLSSQTAYIESFKTNVEKTSGTLYLKVEGEGAQRHVEVVKGFLGKAAAYLATSWLRHIDFLGLFRSYQLNEISSTLANNLDSVKQYSQWESLEEQAKIRVTCRGVAELFSDVVAGVPGKPELGNAPTKEMVAERVTAVWKDVPLPLTPNPMSVPLFAKTTIVRQDPTLTSVLAPVPSQTSKIVPMPAATVISSKVVPLPSEPVEPQLTTSMFTSKAQAFSDIFGKAIGVASGTEAEKAIDLAKQVNAQIPEYLEKFASIEQGGWFWNKSDYHEDNAGTLARGCYANMYNALKKAQQSSPASLEAATNHLDTVVSLLMEAEDLIADKKHGASSSTRWRALYELRELISKAELFIDHSLKQLSGVVERAQVRGQLDELINSLGTYADSNKKIFNMDTPVSTKKVQEDAEKVLNVLAGLAPLKEGTTWGWTKDFIHDGQPSKSFSTLRRELELVIKNLPPDEK